MKKQRINNIMTSNQPDEAIIKRKGSEVNMH